MWVNNPAIWFEDRFGHLAEPSALFVSRHMPCPSLFADDGLAYCSVHTDTGLTLPSQSTPNHGVESKLCKGVSQPLSILPGSTGGQPKCLSNELVGSSPCFMIMGDCQQISIHRRLYLRLS